MRDTNPLIYALHDPTEQSQRVYIGKTSQEPNRRLRGHISAGRSGRPQMVARWIASLLARGAMPAMVPLEKIRPTADWQEAERFWIAYFRFIGAEMANGADGGEGWVIGMRHTMESRRKMAIAQRGRLVSPEARRNIGLAQIGRKRSEASKSKQRDYRHSDEAKRKISEAGRHRVWRAETRQKIAAANAKRRASPETRRKQSLAKLGRKLSPEHIANLVAAKRKG